MLSNSQKRTPARYVIVASMVMLQLVHGQSIVGEDRVDTEMIRPHVEFMYMGSPEMDFANIGGTYRLQSRSMAAAIPIVEWLTPSPTGTAYSAILLRGSVSAVVPTISFLTHTHTLVASTLGITAGRLTANHNMYILSFNVGFAEDEKTIEDFRLRASGLASATTMVDKHTGLVYGVVYSYNFERGLLLPILGVQWYGDGAWRFAAVVPFSVHAQLRLGRKSTVGIFLRPSGNRFRFSNEGVDGVATGVLDFRVFQLQTGINATYDLDETVQVGLELGILGMRRLRLTADQVDVVNTSIKPSGYLSLGLRLGFGSSTVGEGF